MIPAVPGYQRDIYKCASCEGWVARGDVFCKHCGHQFTSMDVEEMDKGSSIWKHWNAPFHTNYSETIKCVSCEGAVASTDKYCKRCGYDLSKPEQQRMVALDSEQTEGHLE